MSHKGQAGKIYRLETETGVRYIRGRRAVQAYLGCTVKTLYAMLQGSTRRNHQSANLTIVECAPDGVEVLTIKSLTIETTPSGRRHPEWLHVDKKRTRFRITLPNEVITVCGRKAVCEKLGIHSSGLDVMLSNPNATYRKQPIKIERVSGDIRACNTYTVFIDGVKHVVEGLRAVGDLLGCAPSFASSFRDNPRSYKGRDIRVVLGEAKRGRFDYEVTIDGVTKVVRGWVDTAQLIGCKYAGLHRFMDRERLFKGRRIMVKKVLTSVEQGATVEA